MICLGLFLSFKNVLIWLAQNTPIFGSNENPKQIKRYNPLFTTIALVKFDKAHIKAMQKHLTKH